MNQTNLVNKDKANLKDEYILKMVNISKSFLNGAIKANQNINLLVKPNSIHAIIGENGAGKSTLMSILFGMYEADEGEIFIYGKKVKFKSSKDAVSHKIGMVHQHFKLIDNFTVLDNIILGNENAYKSGFLNKNADKKKINEIIKKYHFNVDINQKISALTVGQKQKVEILKVLFRDSNIIIFDEPTAVLSDNEIQAFLQILKEFQKEGKTIIIITHKLHEVKAVAATATVIRKGVYIDTIDVATTSVEEMATLMVGEKVVANVNNMENKKETVVLEVNNLDLDYLPYVAKKIATVEKTFLNLVTDFKHNYKTIFNQNENKNNQKLNKISFKVHAGEIFAIAGVEGNGQSDLVYYLTGLKKANKNAIKFLGKDISEASINQRIKLGLSVVPEDRHKHGLDLKNTVRFNTIENITKNKEIASYGFFIDFGIANYTDSVINKFDVRGSANGTSFAKSLSGGNQQKLIVGREMNKDHKLIIFCQPTRGLDIGAIEYIHSEILKEKKNGNAILLISYELDEILALADTIAVISRKKLLQIGDKKIMTRSNIGNLLAGEGL